jgi:PAS domain-containing protein
MRFARVLPTSLLLLAGCAEEQPRTVAQFMEDEIALYGTLTRCESEPAAVSDAECRNARLAAERITAIEERALRKGREQAFERARDEYRAQLDRERALRIKAEAEAREARLEALIDASPTPEESATEPTVADPPVLESEGEPVGIAED